MTQALYRRYRPSTLADLVGQEHVSEPLQAALAARRVGRVYLFSGPAGCGKNSVARILARSLNCERGPTPTPCGQCRPCRAVAAAWPARADVVEIDAGMHGGLDDVAGVRGVAILPPVDERFRIMIVDHAHMLTGLAFTALPGVVDRAPDSSVFILLTGRLELLSRSLRSRAWHYPLRLIRPSALGALVDHVCVQEGTAIEPAALSLVVRAGDGSARQTLSALEPLLAAAGSDGITHRSAAALIGDVDPAVVDEMIDAMVGGEPGPVLAALDRALRSTDDAWNLAAILLQRLRDLIVLATVPEAASNGLIPASGGDAGALTRQARLLGVRRATTMADAVAGAMPRMHGDTPPGLILEVACAKALLASGGLGAASGPETVHPAAVDPVESPAAIAPESATNPG